VIKLSLKEKKRIAGWVIKELIPFIKVGYPRKLKNSLIISKKKIKKRKEKEKRRKKWIF